MASSETTNQKMFSIIMATYNCGQKVENTLQSILSQNEELFELIVVDGASTDDTLDYIKKYESSLTLISEKDEGVYYAFNKGINLATGKYMYFIGAGDCLKPGVLEQVKEFLPHEAPAFVYGNCYLMKHKFQAGKNFSSSHFISENICHQSIFYHRTVFDIVGKYDLQYKVFADWILNLKCFTHPGISKLYIPCLIADFEEGGLSSEFNSDPTFKKDFSRLIKQQLGILAYCKALVVKPHGFSNGKGYALLKHLIPLARPYVYGYRYLKKAIKNKI